MKDQTVQPTASENPANSSPTSTLTATAIPPTTTTTSSVMGVGDSSTGETHREGGEREEKESTTAVLSREKRMTSNSHIHSPPSQTSQTSQTEQMQRENESVDSMSVQTSQTIASNSYSLSSNDIVCNEPPNLHCYSKNCLLDE